MNNQKGIASTVIVLIAIIVIAVIAYFIFGEGINLGGQSQPSPTPSSQVSNEDFRGTIKDPNDPRYDLVKEKYSLTPAQLEILSRVAEGD